MTVGCRLLGLGVLGMLLSTCATGGRKPSGPPAAAAPALEQERHSEHEQQGDHHAAIRGQYVGRYGLELAGLLLDHVDSIGGVLAIASLVPRVVHASLDRDGHVGSVRTHVIADGRYRQTTVNDSLVQTQGFNGEQAWRVDPSGRVQLLSGAEADRVIFAAALESRRYIDPAWQFVEFVAAPPETLLGLPYDVLRMRGRSGLEMRLFLDRAEHMIRRTEVDAGGQRSILEYEDYRTQKNVALPFRVDQLVAESDRPLRLSVDHIEPMLPYDPMIFQPPAADVVIDLRLDGGDRALGLPIETAGASILVKGMVDDGPPLLFLLDTTIRQSVLDQQVAERLGLSAVSAGATGGTPWTRAQRLRVGTAVGVTILEPRLSLVDLGPRSAAVGRPLAGVLGGDFFERLVVALDFQTGSMDLFIPHTYYYRGPGADLRLSFVGGLPRVVALIEGRLPGRFVLNLGQERAVVLHAPFALEQGLVVDPAAQSVGGTFELGSLVLNGRTLENVEAVVRADPNAGATGAGSLGFGVWSRFHLVIDYQGQRAWIDGPLL